MLSLPGLLQVAVMALHTRAPYFGAPDFSPRTRIPSNLSWMERTLPFLTLPTS